MKTTIPIITFFIFFTSFAALGQHKGQKKEEVIFETNDFLDFVIDTQGYAITVADTLYYPNSKIKEFGNVVLMKDSIKSNLKIGLWTEYYPTGNIKSIGNYQIDSYTECCWGGPCKQFKNYKLGEWKYFYENNQLRANGTYIIKRGHIKTNCSGGDKIFKGYLDKSWTYYNNKGEKMKLSKDFKRELQNTGH